MSRTLTLILTLGMLVLLGACSTPRKACRKAQRHMAKAAYLCPEALTVMRDTVTLPGLTIHDTLEWAVADADSLLALCDTLRHAAEVIALNGLKQSERLRAELERQKKLVSAVQVLRTKACRIYPIQERTADYDLDIWQDPRTGQLVHHMDLHPRKVPCPPVPVLHDGPIEVQEVGVATWYRTVFWLLVVLAAITILYTLARHHAGG